MKKCITNASSANGAGISFMVRIRNEDKTLEKSILSLSNLTFNYEIILILHCCTDRSLEIAKNLQKTNSNIKIYEYNIEVSRAGYETLATDASSKHSFVSYCNWCLSKTTLPWVFKWDADFIASKKLIEFLNQLAWEPESNASCIKINAKNLVSNNCEFYLIYGLTHYIKNAFWEIPDFLPNKQIITYQTNNDIDIVHDSELSEVKTYWNIAPWYLSENSSEALLVRERIEKLVCDFGKEPFAMARASNSECDKMYCKLIQTMPNYVNFYS